MTLQQHEGAMMGNISNRGRAPTKIATLLSIGLLAASAKAELVAPALRPSPPVNGTYSTSIDVAVPGFRGLEPRLSLVHASGSTGLGVFEAARATGKLAIGVDADQFAEAPGHILTSMVKGVDAAVYDAIKRVKEKTFAGGISQFGLAESGVGYVYDANNRALIPDDVRARLEALRQEIISGKIRVPATR